MPEPLVIQKIAEQRARLMAHEAATMREMAQRWQGVEDALRADMLDLAMYLDEIRLKGEMITPARLLQMERYKALIADARREQAQYSEWLANSIADDQRQAVGQGITDAQQLIEAAGMDAKIASMAFDHINTGAVEFMAGFAGDGTPLYDLLRASYPESVVRLTDALVQGLARGVGPRATAALMQKHMAGNLDRALLIARTEQLRALRAGSLEQMKQSNVVNGYIRRAQRNSQTCAACLALDGTYQKSAEVFKSHPACRCYAQPVLRYGKTPSFPSGPEWLAKQPESVQRSVLGKGKFELFKDGKLDWGQVAQVHEDPVWGPTILQGKVSEAIRNDRNFGAELKILKSEEIIKIGSLDSVILKKMGVDPINNIDLILTGERRNHYLKSHQEMVNVDQFLGQIINAPDFVSPNTTDRNVVIYYKKFDDQRYFRVAVRLQARSNELKHSIMSFRYCGINEAEKSRKKAL